MSNKEAEQRLKESVEAPDYEKEIFVISVPRSANTITRYVLEHLTGYNSYGYIGSGGMNSVDSRGVAQNIDTRDSSGIIFKRHAWEPYRYTNDKAALDKRIVVIIRNPLDVRMRGDFPESWNKLESGIIENATGNNNSILTKIFFFESLMSDSTRHVKELAEFIDAPQEKLEKFLVNIDEHMSGKKAPEQKTPNRVEPHVRALSEGDRIQKWNALMNSLPEHSQTFFNYHYPNGLWVRRS